MDQQINQGDKYNALYNNCIEAAHFSAIMINSESRTAEWRAEEIKHPPYMLNSYESREAFGRLFSPKDGVVNMVKRLEKNSAKYNTIAEPFGRFTDPKRKIIHISNIETTSTSFGKYLDNELDKAMRGIGIDPSEFSRWRSPSKEVSATSVPFIKKTNQQPSEDHLVALRSQLQDDWYSRPETPESEARATQPYAIEHSWGANPDPWRHETPF